MQKKSLRQMFAEDDIIKAPGAYDAWTAKLVEMAGFSAAYMTGYGTSACLIGKPDIGLLTLTEMSCHAKNIAAALDIPLIADGDNGYGELHNVIRTVEEYERGGVAAIQLEDQVTPKRCGHMEGKRIIPTVDMVAKIKAAVHARKSKDFMIIARTDARAITGLDDAIKRALAYEEAGADIIFIEAPQSKDEMLEISKVFKKPLMANMVEKGKTPFFTSKELAQMGYKLVVYPISTLFAATRASMRVLEELKEKDTTAGYWDNMVGFPQFNELMGIDKVRKLEADLYGGKEE